MQETKQIHTLEKYTYKSVALTYQVSGTQLHNYVCLCPTAIITFLVAAFSLCVFGLSSMKPCLHYTERQFVEKEIKKKRKHYCV